MKVERLCYISQGANPQAHITNISKACESGIQLVQLRLKSYPEDIVIKTAKEVSRICKSFDCKLIINDNAFVAIESQADGVHLGKNDMDVDQARLLMGDGMIIGATANTLEDCLLLNNKPIQYIGLGPFRFTTTKNNLSPILGIEGYSEILSKFNTELPIIAVGGITPLDFEAIFHTGIYGIAISRALTDNFNQTKDLKELIIRLKGDL